ncbi:hypothetical protein [Paenibacillus sp. FSL K6-2524]|uniref:hypothetical protein n=1 Tax=Paenibacillus sp. FSL K6-2524 TaxID=2954516 RepID=UPI0030FC937E
MDPEVIQRLSRAIKDFCEEICRVLQETIKAIMQAPLFKRLLALYNKQRHPKLRDQFGNIQRVRIYRDQLNSRTVRAVARSSC